MALTKAQVSLVTVATLGVTPGGYLAELEVLNTQKDVAAYIATTGLLNTGTNAEYALQVVKNLGSGDATKLFDALEAGASRADATVDFANAVLVAAKGNLPQVKKAIASNSTSKDTDELRAELVDPTDPATSGLRVKFTDDEKNQTENNPNSTKQVIYNVGKDEIINGKATKISADYTFELKDQIGEDDTFTGNFLSPTIDNASAEKSDSTFVWQLRNMREAEDSATPLSKMNVDGFAIRINGDLVRIKSEAILNAENYEELFTAVQNRVNELKNGENLPDGADAAVYAQLETFEVKLGDKTFAQERDEVTGEVTKTYEVTVRPIILVDTAGRDLVGGGYSTVDTEDGGAGFTIFSQQSDEEGQTITKLVTTNLDANNVGYGSQGAAVNLASQSNSDKGIEEIKVTAKNGVWFTKLESNSNAGTDHLQRVELQAGSNDYFNVGTQKNAEHHLVALVDETFGTAGLVDVQQLAAGAAGSVAVNSYITDAVINRYDLDGQGLHNVNNTNALIDYSLTSGHDVLQLQIDSEVVAYAQTQVNITTGGGDDFVHLLINQVDAYGSSWLTNQQLNDNIKITATSGNNVIWTEGSGNANITTGGGADTVYADNSGRTALTDPATVAKLAAQGLGVNVNALYALNAQSGNIGDILSNTANGLDNNTPNTPQVFQTFKNTVSVEFKGFESKFIEIAYDKTNFTTSTQQINKAIQEAINNDATLNKLIVAKEYPGNVLVIESMIDGVQAAGQLNINFGVPTDTAPVAPATLNDGELLITAAELTAAGKAYAPAGTATPGDAVLATMNGFVTGAIKTQYTEAFATEGAGGTPAVAEQQELDFSSITATDAVVGVTMTVGGVSITLNAAGGESGADIATLVANALDGSTALPGASNAVTAVVSAPGVVTVTFDAADGAIADLAVGGTATFDSGTAITTIAGNETVGYVAAVPGAGTPVDGENSSAHSDNVINAGGGNDVIVLGTGEFSNDTVVLEGNFGHNTIVNFDVTAAAEANGGDLLDFTSYLDANYAAAGQADVTLTNSLANGNTVTVVDFSSLNGTANGLAAADLLTTSINTTKLGVELNADFTAGTTAATKHVFLIHNDHPTAGNDGEYLVVTASSTAASDQLAGVKVVGTLDFGEELTFVQGNFVDFA